MGSSLCSKMMQPQGKDPDSTYNMKHEKRGKVVIFNHYKVNGMKEREGTEEDEKRLVKTFKKLGFEVDVKNDRRIGQIQNVMKEVNNEDHFDSDCLVIIVLTHGKENGRLYDSEGIDYDQEELWKPFLEDDPDVPSSLSGKPKMFIIQACRGGRYDAGRQSRSTATTDATPTGASFGMTKIPNNADFLIYRSTPEGYVSYRDGDRSGSWFIKAICDVFDSTLGAGDFTRDLVTLLTRVNQQVAKEKSIPKEDMQIPEICSRLTKDIYFN